MVRNFNKRVKHRGLNVGYMALWKAILATKVSKHDKLAAKWEGPYVVCRIAKPGTFYL